MEESWYKNSVFSEKKSAKSLFSFGYSTINPVRVMFGIGLEHPHFLHTDLNLLLQIATLVIIFVSLFYKKKGNVKLHGLTLDNALIFPVISLVLVMGPSFSRSYTFFSNETGIPGVQTMWLHAIPGGIALLLGIILVALWAIHPSNIAPCYKRKRIMDVTLLLWVISLLFGIAAYILFYA